MRYEIPKWTHHVWLIKVPLIKSKTALDLYLVLVSSSLIFIMLKWFMRWITSQFKIFFCYITIWCRQAKFTKSSISNFYSLNYRQIQRKKQTFKNPKGNSDTLTTLVSISRHWFLLTFWISGQKQFFFKYSGDILKKEQILRYW